MSAGRALKYLFRHKWKITVLAMLVVWWFSLPKPLFHDPASTVIEDRNGQLLGAKIAGDGQWRFPAADSLPEKFKKCIVEFEDRYFYGHPGFNPLAFVRAMRQNFKEGSIVSGGSTLTMQVIRLSRKGKARTIWEKLVEVWLATRIEAHYSKEEILSFYASNAPFGGNVVGLEAAAWRYFGRSSHELSWGETATLAVLPNAPSLIFPGKNHELLKAKRNRLLKRLQENGTIDQLTCELAMSEPLPGKPLPLPQSAPHLLTRAYLESPGKRIQTTVNSGLQKQVNEIVAEHYQRLKENEIHNAAVLVLEVESGDVLAYVGNTPCPAEHDNSVDVITAARSTGSILKPLLFASMLHDGELLPNTLVPDIPTHYKGYQPENYSRSYDGAVPARRALSRSLNVPAVRMLQQHGVEQFHYLLNKAGLSTITRPAGHYGLSLILGGAEASLWELTGLYANLARSLNHFGQNSGKYSSEDWHGACYELNIEKEAQSGSRVLGAASAYLTFQSLLEVNRPEQEEGWEAFSSAGKIAWKTGTSFGFRDAWAIGTTPHHVVGVWVGNADGEGRPGLTGLNAAAPVLFDVFNLLPVSDWFDKPYDELVEIPVCNKSGHRLSQYCEKADTIFAPEKGLRTAACPYHRLVHLDENGRCRVTDACLSTAEMQHQHWFVLPPVMEWYYQAKNPTYRKLPPWKPGCQTGELAAMELIYPRETANIYVPYELDGSKGKTVFEVAHRKPQTEVHWHLDENYLGSTQNFHQMALQPKEGKHLLTLVDEDGETLRKAFEVVGRR